MSQFSHEIGETKQKGESLGRIDVLDSFLVSAPVDQFYLNRVSVGQEAFADLNGAEYGLEVFKIFPAVENGQFEIHLRFTEAEIPNPRRGQNVRVRLSLSATEQALKIPKGGFYGSTGGRFVYVLSEEGVAVKREIELGAQNPEFYKVVSGLEEGEQVILSSYESFGDSETIEIK
jgi:HlyD family secretion protein